MDNNVSAGVVLGVLITIWTAVVIMAGWHTDPRMMWLYFGVVPIEVLVLAMALRTHILTAHYGRQLWNGIAVSTVGAILVFAGTYVLTTVVFPQYFPQIRAAAETMLTEMGRTPVEIAEELRRSRASYDPVANALTGAVGVFLCGVILSLVLAVFFRRPRHPAEHPIHAH